MRSEEEDRIKQQIEETEKLISKELAQKTLEKEAETGPKEVLQLHEPSLEPTEQPNPGQMDIQMEEASKPDLVGEENTNGQKAPPEPESTNDVSMGDSQQVQSEEKAHDDHGGEELVEGQEDDVIY